jgi:mono/diheme cytochrome c family protein
MKVRSSGLRTAKLIPGMCVALALLPSFVSIALGRNASPISGDSMAPDSAAGLKAVHISTESDRSAGGARGIGGFAPHSTPGGASPRGLPHGGIIPPSARTTPRAHRPIRPGTGAPGTRLGAREGNFHGRNFARLNPNELSTWRSGRWLHDEHAGFLGWWWVLGDEWYFYPEPIYPYPDYISDYLIPVPVPLSPQFRYYCDNPPGYYPDVAACYDGWQVVPIAPPSALPPPSGAMANADTRGGFRIARDVCSACHVVQPGQPGGTVLLHPGPSFQEIANRPGTTADSLRTFINGSDWNMATRPITMPRQGLSDSSTEQVVSYILSLKTPSTR